ncbi:RarD protein, DMT superfamily transporter [Psychromonas ingrahamii 37]|uniref:RarD protein, DMT superfamily transporter n=1 Tax=Psychromonas ingrahamii (strain DSM 17664 / CCUG 51855 / 37) TaxID=357804 RepID=A1SSV4_PSYIN|nr:EamA family transporter RarD [Psychromonas ingrahamii]ABM02569.1 RarD protein, DMT superfamily transporter [Psychromonas ingrahamii 37]
MKDLSQTQLGIVYALSAYLLWGINPIFFKYLGFIPVYEILAHRVIWSVVFIAIVITFLGGWGKALSILKTPKNILFLTCTSLLISVNWSVFIWAINNGRMLEASLGYFINPLINVVLGLVFLNEALSRVKWIAVSLALIGVLIQVVQVGSLPWVSLVLPISFGFYGLLRKKIKIEALIGLFFETLLVLPVALYYLFFVANGENVNMLNNNWSLNLWLMFTGIATAMPLFFFAQAALRLKLSTLGFFQYLAPSMMFLMAVFIYGEVLSLARIITFIFIWAGILLFAGENKLKKWL